MEQLFLRVPQGNVRNDTEKTRHWSISKSVLLIWYSSKENKISGFKSRRLQLEDEKGMNRSIKWVETYWGGRKWMVMEAARKVLFVLLLHPIKYGEIFDICEAISVYQGERKTAACNKVSRRVIRYDWRGWKKKENARVSEEMGNENVWDRRGGKEDEVHVKSCISRTKFSLLTEFMSFSIRNSCSPHSSLNRLEWM